MNFVRKDGLLVVKIDNPRSATPNYCELHELGKVDDPIVEQIIEAFLRKFMGSAHHTQINNTQQVLRPFGKFLNDWVSNKSNKGAPADLASWQGFVCDFALWWLVRSDSKAALSTRCWAWNSYVLPYFEYLQVEDVLPFGVVCPKLKLPKEQINASPQQPKLIGELPARAVPVEHAIEKTPIDRTLAGPVFWRGDVEYLDEIETTLRQRDALLASVLDDYWLKLVKDYRSGRRLKCQISDADWQAQEVAGDWAYGYLTKSGITVDGSKVGQRLPLCSPKNPLGHIWLLKILKHYLVGLDDEIGFTLNTIRAHPALNKLCLKSARQTPIKPFRRLTALSGDQYGQITNVGLVWRFLGLLSPVDMAVAMAILIREHPNFTPEAIAGAKLLCAHGKSYLLMTDSGEHSAIFSVNKPRAGSRKYAPLSKRSGGIMRHLLRTTAPVRDLLRRSGHPHWRYLFLGWSNQKGLGHPKDIATVSLTAAKGRSGLADFYPELLKAGLGVGTLNFSKIRATQGVLAWFDKGSVKAVHQKLGNSYRTSIEHYIPEPLLAAWNERIIRRFQNTLLVLAAADEGYLLDVVDMTSLAELHRFLAQLVYELPPGRSPIADRIQSKFGARYRIEGPEGEKSANRRQIPKESLHIRLNPSSIALLLAFRRWANSQLSQEMRCRADHQTGLSPKHFIDLAGMLQAAVQNDQIGKDISRVLDVKALQRQFRQAEPKVADLVKKLHAKSLVFEGENRERWD